MSETRADKKYRVLRVLNAFKHAVKKDGVIPFDWQPAGFEETAERIMAIFESGTEAKEHNG